MYYTIKKKPLIKLFFKPKRYILESYPILYQTYRIVRVYCVIVR